jgi:hypothetical protein
MTCHRTCAVSPVQQFPGHLRLLPELRPPVLKALQHQAVRLAILTLVQIALAPRLMVQSPERLALRPTPHDCPLAH